MPIQVPTVQPQIHTYQGMRLPQGSDFVKNFLSSYKGAREIGQQKALQEQASKAYAGLQQGDMDAMNVLVSMPGGGAQLANQIYSVVSAQDKLEADRLQKNIITKGREYANILDLPEDKRKFEMQKLAMQKLQLGQKTEAQDLMALSQSEDPMEIQTGLMQAVDLAAAGDEYLKQWKLNTFGDTQEINKERRTLVDKSMTALNTRIDAIETSADKIDRLVDQAASGNRSAVSSVLVSLVKLQDPNSAVLEAEMRSALNEKDPKAAVMDLIRSKGTVEGVADSVMAYVDPLAPENIKPEQIRSTANALVQANLVPMQQAYMDNMMKAEGLSVKGKKDVLRGNFGQRLVDMYGKYNIVPEDSLPDNPKDEDLEKFQQSQNSGNLFYNELNRQRSKLGADPLIRPNQLKVEPEVDESALPAVGPMEQPQVGEYFDLIPRPVEQPQVDPYTGQVIGEGVVEVMPDTGVPQAQYEQDESFEAGVLGQAPQEALDRLNQNPSQEEKDMFYEAFNYLPEGF